jgi:ariadne-1
MDNDYEDDDEEYTYEEDGEYDEEGDGDYEDEGAQADAAPVEPSNGRRESSGAAAPKSTSNTPMSGEKRTERGVVVPSDSFNIMDCSEIEPIMQALIEDVASLLDLNCDVTQALLQSHKWNREKLIDAFFANPEKVMKSSGLDLYVDTSDSFRSDSKTEGGPVKLFRSSSNNSTLAPGETFKCRICYDETANAFSMGCGHKFCRPCYSEYLTGQVNDGQSCIIAHCPEFKCTQLVTSSVFHSLLGNRRSASAEAGPGSPASPNSRKIGVKSGKLVNQYDTYYVRNFIETCKNMKYCPAPGCEKVAVGSGVTMVRCSCGHPFCMRCGKFPSLSDSFCLGGCVALFILAVHNLVVFFSASLSIMVVLFGVVQYGECVVCVLNMKCAPILRVV